MAHKTGIIALFFFVMISYCSCFLTNDKLCFLKKNEGNCKDSKEERWFYNSTHCEKFLYSGCGGNENNFESEEICLGTCGTTCKLPLQTGSCDHNITRYYYSTTNKTCEKFIYGGCDKNENHFEDVDSCWKTCKHECTLDPEEGICLAKIDRYYFDIKTGSCLHFTYSGCGGNNNNFETIEECENQCNIAIDLRSTV